MRFSSKVHYSISVKSTNTALKVYIYAYLAVRACICVFFVCDYKSIFFKVLISLAFWHNFLVLKNDLFTWRLWELKRAAYTHTHTYNTPYIYKYTHTHILRVYAYAVVGQLWVSSVSNSLLFTLHHIYIFIYLYIVYTWTVTHKKCCF